MIERWKRGQCGLSPTKGRKIKSQPKAAEKAAVKTAEKPASELISEKIHELEDWRGDTLARMRDLITIICFRFLLFAVGIVLNSG
jgi:hypothetical protein